MDMHLYTERSIYIHTNTHTPSHTQTYTHTHNRITGGHQGLLSAQQVKKIEYEKRRRREEEHRQTQIAPKMISLLRGLVQALGDTSDIDMDFDVRDIARWRFPTQLCVSWHSVFLGVGAAAVAVSLAVTAIGEQRRGRR